MPPSQDKKGIFVASGTKPEEVLEDEVIRKQLVGLTNHLECYYLVNSIGSEHLDVAPILLQNFFLKVRKRKMQTGVKGF